VILHAHAGLDTKNKEDELLKEYCKDFAVALKF